MIYIHISNSSILFQISIFIWEMYKVCVCVLFPSPLIFETFTRAVCGLVIKDQLNGGMDPPPVFFQSKDE